MKGIITSLILFLLVSCVSNQPRCRLASDVEPLPPWQKTPPEQCWEGRHGSLPYSKWEPEHHTPKGVVIIIGGWDTVTGDFRSLADALAGRGYAVYGSENRSFRYGPANERGKSRDWHRWTHDVADFTAYVRQRHPGIPVYWFGQSFGAVVALATLDEMPPSAKPRGLILESPGFAAMHDRPRPVLEGVLGTVGWYRLPHIRLLEWKNLKITGDPQRDCAWLHSTDRWRQGYTIKFLIEFAQMGLVARKLSPDLDLPVLAMWGGRDRLALGGDDDLLAPYDHFMRHELAHGTATHYYRPQGEHVLTEGPDKERAIAAVLSWLSSQP